MDLYIKDKVGFKNPANSTEKKCKDCQEVYALYMFKDKKLNPSGICNKCLRSSNNKKYKLENPKKAGCHAILTAALKSGHLVKQPCEKCGAVANVDGHHPDYEKPLDVVWLCKAHHMQEHGRLRKISTAKEV